MATQAAVFHQELSQCILHKSMLCIQHSLSGRQHGALCWHKPSRLSPAQPPRMPGFLLLLCGSLLSLLPGSSYKKRSGDPTAVGSDVAVSCRPCPAGRHKLSHTTSSTRRLASSSGEQPAHAQHPLVSTPALGSHLTVQHAE